MKLGEPGTLGQPIDPSESGPLGPLWHGGEPTWYLRQMPVLSEEVATYDERHEVVSIRAEPLPDGLILEAYVNEFADIDEVSDALANLGYALNAFHIESGGNGLVIDDWRIYMPTPEPAEVD